MKVFVSEDGKVGRLHTIVMNLIELFDKRIVKKKKSQRDVTVGAVTACPAQEKERMTCFQVKITKLAPRQALVMWRNFSFSSIRLRAESEACITIQQASWRKHLSWGKENEGHSAVPLILTSKEADGVQATAPWQSTSWAELTSGGKALCPVRAVPGQWSPEGGSPQPLRRFCWVLSEKGVLEDVGLCKMKPVCLPSEVFLRAFKMPVFYESLIWDAAYYIQPLPHLLSRSFF